MHKGKKGCHVNRYTFITKAQSFMETDSMCVKFFERLLFFSFFPRGSSLVFLPPQCPLKATGRPIVLMYLGLATGRGTYKILAYLS